MKKFLCCALVILMFVLVGCSPTNDDTPLQTTEPVKEASVFEQFEDFLTDNDYEYEKVAMAAEMVGAYQGNKYKINNGQVELYLFDEKSDAYKQAYSTQSLYLDGFGAFDAIVDKGMAIIVSDLPTGDFEVLFNQIDK